MNDPIDTIVALFAFCILGGLAVTALALAVASVREALKPR